MRVGHLGLNAEQFDIAIAFPVIGRIIERKAAIVLVGVVIGWQKFSARRIEIAIFVAVKEQRPVRRITRIAGHKVRRGKRRHVLAVRIVHSQLAVAEIDDDIPHINLEFVPLHALRLILRKLPAVFGILERIDRTYGLDGAEGEFFKPVGGQPYLGYHHSLAVSRPAYLVPCRNTLGKACKIRRGNFGFVPRRGLAARSLAGRPAARSIFGGRRSGSSHRTLARFAYTRNIVPRRKLRKYSGEFPVRNGFDVRILGSSVDKRKLEKTESIKHRGARQTRKQDNAKRSDPRIP